MEDSSLSSIEEIISEGKTEMISPHFEPWLNYDYYNYDDGLASYLSLQQQISDYERQFNAYNYFTADMVMHNDAPVSFCPAGNLDTVLQPQKPEPEVKPAATTGKVKHAKQPMRTAPYSVMNTENKENEDDSAFPPGFKQDEFVMCVKRQRIRLGFTQADVGISLGALYNKHFSQTTVCR